MNLTQNFLQIILYLPCLINTCQP